MPAIHQLLAASVTHERVADDVASALIKAAWIGLALLVVEGGLILFGWPGSGLAGLSQVVTGAGVLVGLGTAAGTRGFRRASTLGQSIQLSLLGLAVAVPVLWVLAFCLG